MLNTTSYGMEYPFDQLGSVVLATSSPNILLTSSTDTVQALLHDSQNTGVLPARF